MRAIIHRTQKGDKQTLGELSLYDNSGKVLDCKTLELPWKDNQRQISCIPPGTYIVVPRNSPKFSDHFHVTNVPGRSYILIHPGNYHTQIQGCILVGRDHIDINGDGDKDVTASKDTLHDLLMLAPGGFELIVI